MTKRSALVALLFTSMLFISTSQADAGDKTDFDKFINSKRYNAIDPAVNWWYPGGFVVVTKAGTGFFRLPDESMIPKAQPGTAYFYKQSSDSKFSLSALLTNMLSLLPGNPGVTISASKSSDFAAVAASASLIDNTQATQLANDPRVKQQMDLWLSDPKHTQVYAVLTVASSKTLSLTTSHSIETDLTFNGAAPNSCTASPASQNGSNNSTSGASNKNGNSGPSANDDYAQVDANSPSNVSQTNGTSNNPGGTFQLCITGNKSLVMNADQPMDFAAQVSQVTKLANGSYYVSPVNIVVPHIGALAVGAEGPELLPPYNGTSLSNVQVYSWPTVKQ